MGYTLYDMNTSSLISLTVVFHVTGTTIRINGVINTMRVLYTVNRSRRKFLTDVILMFMPQGITLVLSHSVGHSSVRIALNNFMVAPFKECRLNPYFFFFLMVFPFVQ